MDTKDARPWGIAPETVTLDKNEVHVWRVELDRPRAQVESLFRVLAEDEAKRALRFHFEKDKTRFTVARASLRIMLARYLGLKPEQIRFSYAEYGKPGLGEEFQSSKILFNVSHSNSLALIAIARDREVGVDVEFKRSGVASEQIPERFFSASEVKVLRALPQSLQDEAFFNCWTRKEAYIKAIGEGLSMPLDAFDVSLAPGEEAALLRFHKNPEESLRWKMRELYPGPGYAGAIVVEGDGWHLKCWEWSD